MQSPGYSFCIITNGKRPEKLRREIESIRALHIPNYEILIGGDVPPGFEDAVIVPAVEAAANGRLGEMRNRLVERARFDHLIVADDDMIFHADFYRGLQQFGEDYDVLCIKLLNPDGTRFWDWATFGGVRFHILLDYGEVDPCIYVTGGFCIMKSYVADKVRWDENRGFYQQEDIDFSRRLKAAGFKFKHCTYATVTHDDPRYTRIGSMVVNTALMQDFREITPGIFASGFGAEEAGGYWLSRQAELIISGQHFLQPVRLSFDLLCGSCELYDSFPFEVHTRFDHKPYRVLTFRSSDERKRFELEISPRTHALSLQLRAMAGFIRAAEQRDVALRLADLRLTPAGEEQRARPALLPETLRYTGPLFNFSAEAALARGVISGLEERGVRCSLHELNSSEEFLEQLRGEPSAWNTWEQRRKNSEQPAVELQIVDCSGGSSGASLSSGLAPSPVTKVAAMWRAPAVRRAALVACDASHLPPAALEGLRDTDQLFTPCRSRLRGLMHAGLPESRMHVIPWGIDTELFDPKKPTALSLDGRKRVNFLSVFCWEDRKGWDTLLRAYVTAFGPSDDVCLILRTWSAGGENLPEKITSYIESIGVRMDDAPSLILYTDFLPPAYLPALYRSADAFVLPSRSEHSGASFLEAGAMGLAVIAPRSTAPECLTDENAYLIEDRQGEDVRWQQTAAFMREVFENPEAGRAKAKKLQQTVREHHSLTGTIELIAARLKDGAKDSILPPARAGRAGNGKEIGRGEAAVVIGIDARTLVFTETTLRGIGHYTANHLKRVMERTPDWRYVFFLENLSQEHDALDAFLALPNASCAALNQLDRYNLKLFHIPDPMTMPRGFDSPFRIAPSGVPLSVVFYDLIPLVERGLYLDTMSSFERAAYLSRLEQLKVSGAHILAISEHTKADLRHYLDIPDERITAIMAGVNSASAAPPSADQVEQVKRRLGINAPFFLSVGSLEPHKNFLLTMHAFLAACRSTPLQLVVAGTMHDPYKRHYKAVLQQNNIGNVLFTGYIRREELDCLYAAAAGLVFPSRYEGFGLPVVEAMAKGCPVITSTAASLPEAAGEAALYVSPNDIDGLARTMLQLVQDRSLSSALVGRGYAQAQLFTWEKTAEHTVKAWQRVMDPKLSVRM